MRKALLAAVLLLPAPALAEETLRIFPPAGYAGVHVSDGGGARLVEYLPEGETPADWSEALTVAELRGTGEDAAGYVARLSADLARACPEAFALDPEIEDAGGRAATMSIHACQNLAPTGRSEVAILRVIEGEDRLFAIQKAWTTTPPREELDRWSDWLRALQVCDDGGCR